MGIQGDEHIFRLDVAVHNIVLVAVLNAFGYFSEYMSDIMLGQLFVMALHVLIQIHI